MCHVKTEDRAANTKAKSIPKKSLTVGDWSIGLVLLDFQGFHRSLKLDSTVNNQLCSWALFGCKRSKACLMDVRSADPPACCCKSSVERCDDRWQHVFDRQTERVEIYELRSLNTAGNLFLYYVNKCKVCTRFQCSGSTGFLLPFL